jgi:hypothetical protein
MQWIRNNVKIVVPATIVFVVVVAYLAFGVFGIQTLFIDDKVDEAAPVFDSGAGASGLESDSVDEAIVEEINEVMADEDTPVEVAATDPMPEPVTTDSADEAVAEPVIVSLYDGSFVPRSHPGEGTVSVLNDGSTQRFLRFEDFATDNGPDLNVYLTSAGADASADDFGRDFIDLGDLKGNIGPQNYEIPDDVDLDRYGTVVVWCVRFSVAFTAADLAPTSP